MKTPIDLAPLSWKAGILFAVATVASFHLAYAVAGSFMGLFLFFLFGLTRVGSARKAFYFGLAIGFGTAAPQLRFFWGIFGHVAVVLWLVLAFWIGLFLLCAHLAVRKYGSAMVVLVWPILWTGLEYFRSELYPLRFSWVNVGYAFSAAAGLDRFAWFGVYGIGFILSLCAAILWRLPVRWRTPAGVVLLAVIVISERIPTHPSIMHGNSGRELLVAGMQVEFPPVLEVPDLLSRLIRKYPGAQLLVLSEYTFDGPVPERVKRWCREHERYLVVGGKQPVGSNDFFNTAFVVGPRGEIVFQQAKSVPIQFFRDGRAAKEQRVWNSPWGKIGICICYDLSYARVTDRLIRQGAEALVVPTMDVEEWGQQQHRLHARVAPWRAAEYGVPIFRIASSGVSQCVNRRGQVLASTGIPDQEEMLFGRLQVQRAGRFPLDRWLAPVSTAITFSLIGWWSLVAIRDKFRQRSQPRSNDSSQESDRVPSEAGKDVSR